MDTPEQKTNVSPKPTIEDAVALLVADLPIPVQNFVTGPERARVTIELSRKYGLHVDQAGEFERAFIFMLLGIATPEEFVSSLKAVGLSPDQVNGLTEDVNKEVFARLRAEERANLHPVKPGVIPAPAAQESALPTRPPVPIYSPLPAPSAPTAPPASVTQTVERPAKQVPPPPNLPGQMPERPTPPPPRIEIPTPPPIPPPQPRPVPQVPVEASHADGNPRVIHTMARDMQALKGGTDPFRVAHPEPPAWTRETAKPAPTPAPQPAAPALQSTPSHELATPHPQEAMRTHLKQYGVDPYREPVE